MYTKALRVASMKGMRPGRSDVAYAADPVRFSYETDILWLNRIQDKKWLAEREARILAYIAKVERHRERSKT